MAQVGSLSTSLTLESRQFQVGLLRAAEQAGSSAKSIERSFNLMKGAATAAAGAFALDAFAGLAARGLEFASSLGEVAQQLGVSTRDLQVYRFAASQAGISQEAMDKSLAKLTLTLGQARAGAKGPSDAFRELGGIIGRDIVSTSRTAGDAIPQIAEALSKVEDPARRARLEVALFGRSGQQLDTLLSGGRAGIDELRKAAERLGIVIDDKFIQQADEAADRLGAVKQVLEAQIAGVVAQNADSIVKLATSLSQLTAQLIRFANTNPEKLVGILAGLAGARIGFSIGRFGGLPGAAAGTVIGGVGGYLGGAAAAGGEESREEKILKLQGYLKGNLSRRSRARYQAELRPLLDARNREVLGGLPLLPDIPIVRMPPATIGGSGRSRLGRQAGGGGSTPKKDDFAEFLEDTRFLGRDFDPSGEVTFGTVRFTIDPETSDALRRIRDLTEGGVDLSIAADSIAEADEQAKEYLKNYEDALRQIEDNRLQAQAESTRELAGLYQSLFQGGTQSLWRDFKSLGLAVLSELAAKFTIATLAGQAFNLGDALTGTLSSFGFGGIPGLKIPGRANGGPVMANRPYIVGERRPELFVPSVPGRIIADPTLGGGAMRVEIVDTTGLFETRVSRISASVAAPIAQATGRAAMVGGASLARQQAAQAASRRLGR
jgi:hypothetical protein